jgi:putative DNA methylase
MNWDFGEANLLGENVGGFGPIIDYVADCLTKVRPQAQGQVLLRDARDTGLPERSVIISTDPPYYDSVPYANLSDFFYVWMRENLGNVFGDNFKTLGTPKVGELVASPSLFPDKQAAMNYFSVGMGEAITEMLRVAHPDFPLAIYYAFKQSEDSEDGISSTGWETFLSGVIDSGCEVIGTWPIRSEQSGRMMGLGQNVLASSIVLVCRPRKSQSIS